MKLVACLAWTSVVLSFIACSEGSSRPPAAEGDGIPSGAGASSADASSGASSGVGASDASIDSSDGSFADAPAGFACFPDLPVPVISIIGRSTADAGGHPILFIEYHIENALAYPDTLFAETTVLGGCGSNKSPARSWIWVEAGGGILAGGYCGLTSASAISGILRQSFEGVTVPTDARVVIHDRACQVSYKSSVLAL